MGLPEIRLLKKNALLPKPKKIYRIAPKSAKKIKMEALEKELYLKSQQKGANGANLAKKQVGKGITLQERSEATDSLKSGKSEKQRWFEARRKQLTGFCACGCAQKSQKNDDTFYFHCCCHVWPQKLFPSVQFHPRNFVERTFWGGHHTNFDEQGMNKWPGMADWDNICEIFHELAPLLTDQERKTKFYHNFENLVYYGNIEGKKNT